MPPQQKVVTKSTKKEAPAYCKSLPSVHIGLEIPNTAIFEFIEKVIIIEADPSGINNCNAISTCSTTIGY